MPAKALGAFLALFAASAACAQSAFPETDPCSLVSDAELAQRVGAPRTRLVSDFDGNTKVAFCVLRVDVTTGSPPQAMTFFVQMTFFLGLDRTRALEVYRSGERGSAPLADVGEAAHIAVGAGPGATKNVTFIDAIRGRHLLAVLAGYDVDDDATRPPLDEASRQAAVAIAKDYLARWPD